MKGLSKFQGGVILCAIVLVAALYSMDTTSPIVTDKGLDAMMNENGSKDQVDGTNLASIISIKKSEVSQEKQKIINELENQLSTEENKEIISNAQVKLGNIWKELKVYSIASHYYKQYLNDHPEDDNVKCDLALCMIETSQSPMEVVKILLDIVKKNPYHLKANLSLGILSIKSGQYDKAQMRFETVLKLEPSHTESMFYLSETYKLMGNEEEANKYLKRFNEIVEKSS